MPSERCQAQGCRGRHGPMAQRCASPTRKRAAPSETLPSQPETRPRAPLRSKAGAGHPACNRSTPDASRAPFRPAPEESYPRPLHERALPKGRSARPRPRPGRTMPRPVSRGARDSGLGIRRIPFAPRLRQGRRFRPRLPIPVALGVPSRLGFSGLPSVTDLATGSPFTGRLARQTDHHPRAFRPHRRSCRAPDRRHRART